MANLKLRKSHPPSSTELQRILAQVPELNLQFDEAAADALLAREGTLFIAEMEGEVAGFKAGYDRYQDGSYYSWLGGVVPVFRKQGVAQSLLEQQEAWVLEAGYRGIYVKTRNRFVGMRMFLAKNGYDVVGIELPEGEARSETRIMHYKALAQSD